MLAVPPRPSERTWHPTATRGEPPHASAARKPWTRTVSVVGMGSKSRAVGGGAPRALRRSQELDVEADGTADLDLVRDLGLDLADTRRRQSDRVRRGLEDPEDELALEDVDAGPDAGLRGVAAQEPGRDRAFVEDGRLLVALEVGQGRRHRDQRRSPNRDLPAAYSTLLELGEDFLEALEGEITDLVELPGLEAEALER